MPNGEPTTPAIAWSRTGLMPRLSPARNEEPDVAMSAWTSPTCFGWRTVARLTSWTSRVDRADRAAIRVAIEVVAAAAPDTFVNEVKPARSVSYFSAAVRARTALKCGSASRIDTVTSWSVTNEMTPRMAAVASALDVEMAVNDD